MSRISGYIRVEASRAWETAREALREAESRIATLARDKQADANDREVANEELRFIRELLGKL